MEHNPIQRADGSAYRRKMMLAVPQLTQLDALLTTQSNVTRI